MSAASPPGERWDPWRERAEAYVVDGYSRLDLLTAVDRPADDVIEVVIHLVRPADGARVFGHTHLDRSAPVLDSVTGALPAASWHEREIAEMFGVEVRGHPDPRPLLLHVTIAGPPLRKDVTLVAREETPWPGTKR